MRVVGNLRVPGLAGTYLVAFVAMVELVAASAATLVTHPFVGVTHYQRTETAPRPLVIHIFEINLGAPGIAFVATPGNGAKPGDTTRQRTSEFVAQTGAQIGINGTFYTTAGTGSGPNGTEYYAELTYFAYAAGLPVFTWSGSGDPDERGINIASNGVATFIRPYAINQPDYNTRPVGTLLHNAIGTYDGILIGNTITATDVNLHPRTAMGLNANRAKLYLFVVDGRQPGYSEGMTTVEIAQLLQSEFGVTDAINLDGGGSTTLVLADPGVRVVNSPSDGAERLQGCNFGVLAATPQSPVFVSGSAQVTGNKFQVTVLGTPGAVCQIHSSTNLQSWETLQTLVMTNTTTTFVYSNTFLSRCFYRASLVP